MRGKEYLAWSNEREFSPVSAAYVRRADIDLQLTNVSLLDNVSSCRATLEVDVTEDQRARSCTENICSDLSTAPVKFRFIDKSRRLPKNERLTLQKSLQNTHTTIPTKRTVILRHLHWKMPKRRKDDDEGAPENESLSEESALEESSSDDVRLVIEFVDVVIADPLQGYKPP